MNKFYVGQKVVCINPANNWHPKAWMDLVPNRPVEKGIYTIRRLDGGNGINKGKIGLLLIEITNQQIQWAYNGESGWDEPSFNEKAFRPLVEKETDISIFKKMLNPSKIHENI